MKIWNLKVANFYKETATLQTFFSQKIGKFRVPYFNKLATDSYNYEIRHDTLICGGGFYNKLTWKIADIAWHRKNRSADF